MRSSRRTASRRIGGPPCARSPTISSTSRRRPSARSRGTGRRGHSPSATSYIGKIELYGGEKIGFVGESIEGDVSVVRTKLVTKQGTEIPVDYRMLRRGDRWLVYDVVIEGVSLIANYRTQFNKIITTSSFQELIKKMRTKQEEFIQGEKRASQ
ncbi:MAG: hypothetical protein DMD96_14915 [Candidatus Rokuibacteriota bacterium]|nr:MAG: hypothetical protein DMD96_14915 [Candidatus Rokubacteria bacterium]